MGLLNAIPGFCIRGEHWALGATMFQASMKVTRTSQMSQDRGPGVKGGVSYTTHPWYGAENYDEDLFSEDARSLIVNQLKPPPDARAVGFKEIRWFGPDAGDANLWSYLRFLEKVFPGAKFIFLTRNIDDILTSAWWAKRDRTSASDFISSFYLLMRNAPVENLFEIDYSDLAVGNPRLIQMYEFLGEHYDAASVEKVLATPHNSSTPPQMRSGPPDREAARLLDGDGPAA